MPIGIGRSGAIAQTERVTNMDTPAVTGMIETGTSATVTIIGTGPLVTVIMMVVGTTRLVG